eukprot:Partr_v1_DN28070_c2_g1_i2_m56822 putative solute carrier family 39 (zinc transporter), member
MSLKDFALGFLADNSPLVNAAVSGVVITASPLILTLMIPVSRVPGLLWTAGLGFACGSLLANVFAHTLPELLHSHSHDKHDHSEVEEGEFHFESGHYVLVGIAAFMLLDRFIRLFGHSHDHSHGHSHHSHVDNHSHKHEVEDIPPPATNDQSPLRRRKQANSTSATKKPKAQTSVVSHPKKHSSQLPILTLVANTMHTISDGIQLGLVHASGSHSTALSTTFAIFAHEIPHKLSDYAILVNSGYSLSQCLLMQLLMSAGTFIGIFGVFYLQENLVSLTGGEGGVMLLVSAGGIVYSAAVGMIPDIVALPLSEFAVALVSMALGVWTVGGGHHG